MVVNGRVESSKVVNVGQLECEKLTAPSGSQLLSRLSPLTTPRITTTFPVSQNGGVESR